MSPRSLTLLFLPAFGQRRLASWVDESEPDCAANRTDHRKSLSDIREHGRNPVRDLNLSVLSLIEPE